MAERAVAVGSDADLAIIDPTIKEAPYLGRLAHARSFSVGGLGDRRMGTAVILRGKLIADGGKLLGTGCDGQLAPRR